MIRGSIEARGLCFPGADLPETGHWEIRSAYVRKEKSTRGHFIVVMLAYLVEQELERCRHDLETAVPEGIGELGSARSVWISIREVPCHQDP